MATEVLMPKLGLTMTEGTIEEWKYKEGDAVKKGDILFSVATDKLTNDVECEEDGTLLKILLPEGETAPCKSVIAWIGQPGEAIPDASGAAAPAAAAPVAAPAAAAAAGAVAGAAAAGAAAAGAAGAAAGAAAPAASGTASPAAPIQAITLLQGAVSPSGSRIFSRVPSSSASTSLVSLSVATENRISPFLTVSPSLNFHSSMVPSVMVRPSLGIRTSVAIISVLLS